MKTPWSFLHNRTIRTRLALLSASVFLLAGAVLIGITYVQLDQAVYNAQTNRAVLQDEAVSTPAADPAEEQQRQQKLELYQQSLRDDAREQTVDSMIRIVGITLLLLLGATLGLGWLVARQSLRPVQRITATARRVASGNLSERIALAGPRDELRELADTFDHMLARLDAAFEAQRRFVANASHELKTPLTINRAIIEVAVERPDAPPELRELAAKLLRVNDRQEHMIDGLLALAESERAPTVAEPVNLGEIVRTTVGVLRPEADARDVALNLAIADAYVPGDPVLLERLAINLVQNAIRHNVDGGSVEVSCAETADAVRLRVENTGESVPADRVEEMFEPFRRLVPRARSRTGNGLGLSIVRAVAAAHGGTVTAHPREGGGLTVVATLRPAGGR